VYTVFNEVGVDFQDDKLIVMCAKKNGTPYADTRMWDYLEIMCRECGKKYEIGNDVLLGNVFNDRNVFSKYSIEGCGLIVLEE
jgi:hypothetical protein